MGMLNRNWRTFNNWQTSWARAGSDDHHCNIIQLWKFPDLPPGLGTWHLLWYLPASCRTCRRTPGKPGRERAEHSSTQLHLLPHRALQQRTDSRQTSLSCSQTLCNTAQALWPHVNLPTQGLCFPQEPET